MLYIGIHSEFIFAFKICIYNRLTSSCWLRLTIRCRRLATETRLYFTFCTFHSCLRSGDCSVSSESRVHSRHCARPRESIKSSLLRCFFLFFLSFSTLFCRFAFCLRCSLWLLSVQFIDAITRLTRSFFMGNFLRHRSHIYLISESLGFDRMIWLT